MDKPGTHKAVLVHEDKLKLADIQTETHEQASPDEDNTPPDQSRVVIAPERSETDVEKKKPNIIVTDNVPNKRIWKPRIPTPPTDKDGLTPRDVVIRFLEDVQNNNKEEARQWWAGEPRDPDPIGFDEYFEKIRSIDVFKVGLVVKGKSIYWIVWFDYDIRDDLEPLHIGTLYYLTLVDGRWRLVRSFNW